jgi:PEP-CTERM motif
MNYRTSLTIVALVLGTAIHARALAGPNLLTNGGFETGDFTGWTASVDPTFSGIDGPAAHTGDFGAFFGDSGTPGSISQSFSTLAGAAYDIRFWLRSDGLTPNSIEVLWGGTTVYSSSNLAPFSYTEIVLDSLAMSGLTMLELRARDDNGFLEIDDISVSAIPEPSTIALLGAGLAAMAGLRRARKV